MVWYKVFNQSPRHPPFQKAVTPIRLLILSVKLPLPLQDYSSGLIFTRLENSGLCIHKVTPLILLQLILNGHHRPVLYPIFLIQQRPMSDPIPMFCTFLKIENFQLLTLPFLYQSDQKFGIVQILKTIFWCKWVIFSYVSITCSVNTTDFVVKIFCWVFNIDRLWFSMIGWVLSSYYKTGRQVFSSL